MSKRLSLSTLLVFVAIISAYFGGWCTATIRCERRIWRAELDTKVERSRADAAKLDASRARLSHWMLSKMLEAAK